MKRSLLLLAVALSSTLAQAGPKMQMAPPTPALDIIPVHGQVISIDVPHKDFELQEVGGRISRYSLSPRAHVVPAARLPGGPSAASLQGIRVGDRCAVTASPQGGEQVTTDVDCSLLR